jgi:uncharacterized protein YcaQ
VARVDLKADRAGSGALLVQASWLEPGHDRRAPAAGEVAAELAAELDALSRWLELDGVRVAPRGDLASLLTPAVSRVRGR